MTPLHTWPHLICSFSHTIFHSLSTNFSPIYERTHDRTLHSLQKRRKRASGSLPKLVAMRSETVPDSPESDITDISFDETELTLGLPGAESRPMEGNKLSAQKPNAKRGFQDTIDIGLGSSTTEPLGSRDRAEFISSSDGPKITVMGWPPVRSYRRKTIEMNCKYVKVAADGAPYLRKIDLEMFGSYQELLRALEKMFTTFPISCDYLEECNILNPVKGADEYLPTFEDKDGDWMLVGDVPWKLFIESCKRIRLMKGSEAIGIAPRIPEDGDEAFG